ncbi:MAG: thiol peroxidase [Gammaproteobacteria bacterium]|nr:thiol peroxidase [Gammaproteobacteria bacterium]
MSSIIYNGYQLKLSGELPEIGSDAPPFKLTHGDLTSATLNDYTGKKVILNIFHTLDTPLCSDSDHRFNNLFINRKDVVVLVVSADLPFAQRHLCVVDDIHNVIPLSMMKNKQFGEDYGVLITSGPLEGLLARSIVLIDEKGKVAYTQLVPDLGNEPDYLSALDAAK